jgi:hypothetical protein
MSVSANPLVPKDGSIVITDATGTPLSLTILYEDGDLQVQGLMSDQMRKEEFKTRGIPYAVREVERMSIPFTFTCHATGIIGDGSTALPGDALLKLGAWASATSKASAAQGGAYLLQLAWTGERSNFGATADSSITLKYCSFEVDFAEGIPGKLSIKGTAHALSTDYLTIA